MRTNPNMGGLPSPIRDARADSCLIAAAELADAPEWGSVACGEGAKAPTPGEEACSSRANSEIVTEKSETEAAMPPPEWLVATLATPAAASSADCTGIAGAGWFSCTPTLAGGVPRRVGGCGGVGCSAVSGSVVLGCSGVSACACTSTLASAGAVHCCHYHYRYFSLSLCSLPASGSGVR